MARLVITFAGWGVTINGKLAYTTGSQMDAQRWAARYGHRLVNVR